MMDASIASIYFFVLALAAVISLGVSIYCWYHRHVSGAVIYSWVALSQSATTVAYLLELASERLATKIFWDNVQWLTLSIVAASLTTFVVYFTGQRPLKPLHLWLLLMAFPAVFMLLVITNPLHHLTLGTDAYIEVYAPFHVLEYEITPLGMVMAIYLTGQVVIAFILLVQQYRQAQAAYRKQLLTLVLGVVFSLLGALISTLQLVPGPLDDVNPHFSAVGNVIVVWGLLRYRLFDVAPIARHAVVEGMSDALIVIDLHNRVVDVNEAARELIANFYLKSSIIGTQFGDVFAEWSGIFSSYAATYQPFTFEIAVGEPPHERFFAVSVAPVYIQENLIGGRSIQLKDITNLKRTEIRLREQAEALEIAKRKAEEADQLKSQFLAATSHELRTPLNAIINFNQFVSTGLFGPITEKQVDALDKSTNSARHLLSLINDVLDMSKVEAGRMELNIEANVDLKPEIEDVTTNIKTLIADKPVALNVNCPNDLPLVSADRIRIRQVLLNLLSNAAKFTETGSITLDITETTDKLTFSVKDTGAGIPLKEQALIFEPFRQASRTPNRASGTGLGLPISRRLIEAHGGALWLESTEGEGSKFHFTLPIHPKHAGSAYK